jgi:hypothetical protein
MPLSELVAVVVDPRGSGDGEDRGWPEADHAEMDELKEEPNLWCSDVGMAEHQ